jgi:DNA repair ATPase RecN
MLQSLRIRNLAIIEDVSVEFDDRLNVITKAFDIGRQVPIAQKYVER